tara:strand:- start:719 stop:940 length:222 start_codon:yes stop_codon:yes gene_type:complete
MLFLKIYFSSYVLKYHTIINPIIAKVRPENLIWDIFNMSIFLSIFFIFDGNMAYKMPSINKNRPKAMINSFMN